MAGGSATHAGIGFQSKVAAIFAVHILADEPIQLLDLPPGAKPVSMEMETSAPVDDILVSLSHGGLCFVNVKRSVTLSRNPNSFLASALDQFVRLWFTCNAAHGNTGRNWERPLRPSKDCLLLVTHRERSGRFVDPFGKVLGRLRDHGSVVPRDSLAKTDSEKKAYDIVLGHLRSISKRHTGSDISDELLTSLLSLIRVVAVDPDGASKPPILALLRTSVVSEPRDIERAWLELVSDCQRLAEHRSGADRATFRKILSLARIQLRDVVEIEPDLQQIQNVTRETLRSISHLAHLQVPTQAGLRTIEIERAVTHALVNHSKQNSLLIIGAPGAGKSGALYSAATQLQAEGHPVLAIAVDRHPARTLDELRRDLNLEHPVIEVLRNWIGEKPGVLFIDALDASRGGPSDLTFQDLIRLVLQEAPNWRIVASIREFDLRFGVVYRQLFLGEPVDAQYRLDEFSNVRHLLVPKLNSEELTTVWTASPSMETAYLQGSAAFKELLHSIFNLFLLANILSGGPRDLKGITTQVELLDLYWSYRVVRHDLRVFGRESILRIALDRMLRDRTLRVPIDALQGAETEDLYQLNSDGVLSPAEQSAGRSRLISFAHHVLFDYGIARLTLSGGQADDFAERLTDSDERALFIAPGATMALQMLWQQESDRHSQFWTKALQIAGAEGKGEFCRMLPALVAVSLIENVRDWEFMSDYLRQPDSPEGRASLFLFRHSIGALAAGIAPPNFADSRLGPWPEIARIASEAAIAQVGWMLKPLIAQWVEKPQLLSDRERNDIGVVARSVLKQGSSKAYESGMVIFGIQGVARTFESAPSSSIQAFRQLLTPDHLRVYGHKELFWMAQEMKYLLRNAEYCADLIGDIYRSAYCTPLPSREEVTSLLDSRIVGMTSNKRQDFESARFQLQQIFPRFLERAPKQAAVAFVDTAACTTRAEHEISDQIVPMIIRGVQSGYQADYSYIWYVSRNGYSLFSAFESGLQSLVVEEQLTAVDEIISEIIERNRLACVWLALLRVGAIKPNLLGRRLLGVLCAVPILEGMDTRKAAGDLIKSLHPLLKQQDRSQLEEVILGTNEHTRNILLGCLDNEHIVLPGARQQLEILENSGQVPQNEAPFQIRGGAVPMPVDWWLKEQGVDLSTDANSAMNEAISAVQLIAKPSVSEDRNSTQIAAQWHRVQTLYRTLIADEGFPEALLMTGWDAVAEAAGAAARSVKVRSELEAFPDIDEMTIGAAADYLWPAAPVDRQQSEDAFARAPSWGSPAPRIAAAGALMALARAKESSDERLREIIIALAKDVSPAVRHQILTRVNMLFASDKILMFQLCDIGLTQEQNRGVLSFFLAAIRDVLHARPAWFCRRMVSVDDRFPSESSQNAGRDEFPGQLVEIMLRLWLAYDQQPCGDRIKEWFSDPTNHSERVNRGLFILRPALLDGNPEHENAAQERIRTRTIWLYEQVATRVAPLFVDLANNPNRSEADEATLKTALGILDQLAGQIYFGSGAFDETNQARTGVGGSFPGPLVRARFLREVTPTCQALAQVPYPSVTHYLLQTLEFIIPEDPSLVFRLVTDALVHGSEGQYQLESLGAEIFVRIVRRYLADFRTVLTQDKELRQRLMRALDIFVEAGWPAARRLVYDLPEMLR
jgi:hypothetical protein